MTTLLEKAIAAMADELRRQGGVIWEPGADPRMIQLDGHYDLEKVACATFSAVLTPTVAQVNRGGGKAFAGPQPEGGPPMIYPAQIWREMLSFVIEERDRERDEEGAPEESADGAGDAATEAQDGRG